MQILSFSKYPKLKKLLDYILESLKTSAVVKETFDKYEVDLEEIDLIPICWAKNLEVSARTEKGIIYINSGLLKDCDLDDLEECSKEISHYLIHEILHHIRQTLGSKPTQGSDNGNYLENHEEKLGFNIQTRYLTETEGPEKAKSYVNDVLDHHNVDDKNERKEKKEDLLDTRVPVRTASNKSHEPNYENANDPLFTFHRRRHDKLKLNSHERQEQLERLKKLLEATENDRQKKSAKLKQLAKAVGI